MAKSAEPAATPRDADDDDDDNEIVDTPPLPQRVTRSKLRQVPPPKPVVTAMAPPLPVRQTRSKMARKPVQSTASVPTSSAPSLSVPASATKDGSDTPTPSTEGFMEPDTPATLVKVKGSVCLTLLWLLLKSGFLRPTYFLWLPEDTISPRDLLTISSICKDQMYYLVNSV